MPKLNMRRLDRFGTSYEEGADFAEGAELSGIAEPAARINFGRGRGIRDERVLDVNEAGVAE
jgi:hypothetical protein